MNKTQPPKASALALSPIALFLITFIGTGFYYQSQGIDYAFYYTMLLAVTGIAAIFIKHQLRKKKVVSG